LKFSKYLKNRQINLQTL